MFDYKKIIKSRAARLTILRLLSFVPDKLMLKLQYRIQLGKKLNLKDPKRFTEKLQWYKLYYKNPIMVQCVDKFDVRDYVKEKGLNEILIPCYGVFTSVNDIKWEQLPNSFVMKDTLGGGGVSVKIVKNIKNTSIDSLEKCAKRWMEKSVHKRDGGREWPYYHGKNHRIMFEKMITEPDNPNGLLDYKFFCFDGKTEFLYVMGNRKIGDSVCVNIYDRDFNLLPVQRVGDKPLQNIYKPDNYEEMRAIAEQLASDFPHVRVDLYDINNRVYFGELTFYNASGYMQYEPDEFDISVGEKFHLIKY